MKTVIAMDNWWLTASSWQSAHSCITSLAECFGETSNHPGDSAPLQPRFGALQLLPFPKTKITYEREEISDYQWDSGKYSVAADGDSNKGFCRMCWTVEETLGELCEVTTCLYWRGLFLVSCSFFRICLLLYYMAGYYLKRSHACSCINCGRRKGSMQKSVH